MSTIGSHHHYNPDWLKDDDLVSNFVARVEEFTLLRNELARFPLEGNVQHYLLVGVRGAGKTTLLKRLAVAIRRDVDLKDHLVALSFPEELYQVKNLADFWWAACETLADELDQGGKTAEAARLLADIDRAKTQADPSDDLADDGLRLLLATCAEFGRRPVLLVDNLDLVFQRIEKTGRKRKNPHAPAYWALREALSTVRSPVVIGGSVRLSEPFTDYDKAFYDFFLPKRLGALTLEEARQVLERLAEVRGLPEVRERLRARPGRIEALYELTGGNPRALGFIFELLRQGAGSRAVEDFFRLMDTTTPYYKDRFEELADQAQVVMHALAVRRPGDDTGLRFGHTAAEIAAHAGLPTNTVSTQLDILAREGLVEKSAAHGRTQYRIAEQLFRLWLQMRGNRRLRQNVIGLAEFLEALFEPEELRRCLTNDCESGPLARARLAFAVADAVRLAPMRSGFLACGVEAALLHAQEREVILDDYLVPEDLPSEQAALVRLRDRLRSGMRCTLTDEEQEGLLGTIGMDCAHKERTVDALCNPATVEEELHRLRDFLVKERSRLLRQGLHPADITLLWRKRALGLLPLPHLTPDHAEAACLGEADAAGCRAMVWRLLGAQELVRFTEEAQTQTWIDWGQKYAVEANATEWANVAGTMRRSGQFASAETVLGLARAQGTTARVYYEEGVLLARADEKYQEAENAYRKAIELDSKDALPWYALGILLITGFQRHKEAETAFRKAIELDPNYASPWNSLGILLILHSQRYQEAEAAFCRAIELEPTGARAWNNLGMLLSNEADRHEEAVTAFRKAIEFDPAFALAWINLAICLEKRADIVEAAAAYAHAAALQPDMDPLWRNRYLTVQTCNRIAALRQALESGASEALRQTLTRWAEQSPDLAGALTSSIVVEGFLGPLLANGFQAETLLIALRDQGYDRHARPLLLAFEAALRHRPEMLAELEPEVRGASRKMYNRLVAHRE